jgi:DNA-binding MarR family transcriptional regulator
MCSLTRLYDRHLAPSGLSVSQFSLLAMIEANPEVTLAELARAMVMERTTLLRAVKPLVASGWVARQAAGGRGAIRLSLTAAGRRKIAEATPLWRAAQGAFEAEVGADQAAELRRLILAVGFDR